MTINNQNNLTDNSNKERAYNEPDIIKQDLQAAYLWMKQKKDRIEKRKYEESALCCVDGDGQIIGWTESAARAVKRSHRSLLGKNLSDFLRITDGRSFKDIASLVKPGFPYVINAQLTDDSVNTLVYPIKVSNLMFEGRKLFYLVFYDPEES